MLSMLIDSALRSLALTIVVWSGLKILRIRSTHVTMSVWFFVLISAISMPVLMKLSAIYPSPEVHWPTSLFQASPDPANTLAASESGTPSKSSALVSSNITHAAIDLETPAIGLYLLVASVLLARLIVGTAMTWRLVRMSEPVREDWASELDVRVSREIGGPITFGRTILLPQDYRDWDALKLRAVIAHERSHAIYGHYYILLLSRLHRVLYCFSPAAWWLQGRLMELAEIVSDDEALESMEDPSYYAEVLLGISRAQGRIPDGVAMARRATVVKRVERILLGAASSVRMNLRNRLIVLGSLVPLVIVASGAIAQVQDPATELTRAEIDKRRAEQEQPRSAAPFDPKQFDKYVGYYRMESGAFFTISRDGDHFFERLAAQRTNEIFPESPSKFFLTVVPAQIEFVTGSRGVVKELILHQNGVEQHAPKVDDAVFTAAEKELAERISNHTPSPGTEASIRRFIDSMQKGQPNVEDMTPTLAAFNRLQQPAGELRMQALGALKSLTFKTVTAAGMDDYEAVFELGRAEFYIAPLTPDGKVSTRGWNVVEFTDPAVQQRIKDNRPTPGTEDALRRQIEALEAGKPNYDEMTPALVTASRERQEHMLELIKRWGALKSIAFSSVGRPMGNEIWDVTFEHAHVQAVISPLTPDGKISLLDYVYQPQR